MRNTVLIVEDEQNIVDILSFNLSREGYDTLEAYDGKTGLQLALEQNPDLILLDLMLPELDGFGVCNALRKAGFSTPIIMLTAREEETDKVMGLELGADDYITKPFSMRELLARVKANIRRSTMTAPKPPPVTNDNAPQKRIIIDAQQSMAYKDSVILDLTQREFDLLCYLANQPGQIFSRETLMEHVWNYDGYIGDIRIVDVAIRRLREKLEDDSSAPNFIITKRGLGYYYNQS